MHLSVLYRKPDFAQIRLVILRLAGYERGIKKLFRSRDKTIFLVLSKLELLIRKIKSTDLTSFTGSDTKS